MATHSSTLACEIPWTQKPGRLQFMGRNGITEKEAENLTGGCKKLPLTMHMRGDYLNLTELQGGQVGGGVGKDKGDWKGWGKRENLDSHPEK